MYILFYFLMVTEIMFIVIFSCLDSKLYYSYNLNFIFRQLKCEKRFSLSVFSHLLAY